MTRIREEEDWCYGYIGHLWHSSFLSDSLPHTLVSHNCVLLTLKHSLLVGRAAVLETGPLPPQVSLSVSDLSPPRIPGFTAELNGPCVLLRIRTMRRRFGDRTEPKPTGSGPNQGSGRFGYYFGYLSTQVRVVNSGPVNIPSSDNS